MTDPTENDLEALKAEMVSVSNFNWSYWSNKVNSLITEVETLRERVAWLEQRHSAEMEVGIKERIEAEEMRDRAEAVETHVTELAGALSELLRWHRNEGSDTDEPPTEFLQNATVALATPPEDTDT